MRFWQELLIFFVKFFQDVAYGLGSMMESILRWRMGSVAGIIPRVRDWRAVKPVPRRWQCPCFPYLTNSLYHSQHHLPH